jgi:hypothetical protein
MLGEKSGSDGASLSACRVAASAASMARQMWLRSIMPPSRRSTVQLVDVPTQGAGVEKFVAQAAFAGPLRGHAVRAVGPAEQQAIQAAQGTRWLAEIIDDVE